MSVTGLLFLVAFAGGLAMSFIRHPLWGMYTYLAVTYAAPASKWWGAGLPDLRWSLIAAIVTLLTLGKQKVPEGYPGWAQPMVVKLYIAFLAWMWVQSAWANPLHMEGCILFTKYLLLLFLFHRLIVSEEDIKNFAKAQVAGCFYLSWLAYTAADDGRLEGIGGAGFADSNTLGTQLGTGLIMLGAFAFGKNKVERVVAFIFAVFVANGIVQTESRGAFVGLVAGSIVFYWAVRSGYKLKMAPLIIIALAVGVNYIPDHYFDRLVSTVAGVRGEQALEASAASRTKILSAQWNMFKDHPLGAGYRGTLYLSLDPKYMPEYLLSTGGARASHNTMAAILVNNGVIGITIYLLIAMALGLSYYRVMRHPWRDDHQLYIAATGASLAVVFVAGMASNYLKLESQIWFAGVLLAAVRMVDLEKAKEKRLRHA